MVYGKEWQGEFTKFLCRCAREVRQKGYTMFGVRNHGKQKNLKHAHKERAYVSTAVTQA